MFWQANMLPSALQCTAQSSPIKGAKVEIPASSKELMLPFTAEM
jgi:hypothetical protein